MWAANNNHVNVVNVLLSHSDIDINAKDKVRRETIRVALRASPAINLDNDRICCDGRTSSAMATFTETNSPLTINYPNDEYSPFRGKMRILY